MSVHCKLGETDIPPVGCQGFDPNWCKLQMECPFLEDDTEETSKKLLGAYKKTDVITFRANDALCWFRSMRTKILPEVEIF